MAFLLQGVLALPVLAANVKPTITLVSNFNCGSVMATSTSGTMIHSPTSNVPYGTRATTPGAMLGGAPTATMALAAFTLTGTAGHHYTLSHPTTGTINLTRSGGGTLTVANSSVMFENNSPTQTGNFPPGTGQTITPTLYMGLTLTIPVTGSAPSGPYNSTTNFTLTVTDDTNNGNKTAKQTFTLTAKVDPTPITITQTATMAFGEVCPSSTPGTVTLALDPTLVPPAFKRTASNGASLTSAVAWHAATLTVGGQKNATYTISYPTTNLTLSSGANTMALGAFSSSPRAGKTNLDGSGVGTITLGGTLFVGSSQPAGTYTNASSPLVVTVAYN